jgi:hypothetical protein
MIFVTASAAATNQPPFDRSGLAVLAAAARICAPRSSEWAPTPSKKRSVRQPPASERYKKLEQRAAQGSGAGRCLFEIHKISPRIRSPDLAARAARDGC